MALPYSGKVGAKINTTKIYSRDDTGESLHQQKFPAIYTVFIELAIKVVLALDQTHTVFFGLYIVNYGESQPARRD